MIKIQDISEMKKGWCRINYIKKLKTQYLHHENNGVERDESADQDFPLCGFQQCPSFILPALYILWHEPLQGFRIDHKVETVFL